MCMFLDIYAYYIYLEIYTYISPCEKSRHCYTVSGEQRWQPQSLWEQVTSRGLPFKFTATSICSLPPQDSKKSRHQDLHGHTVLMAVLGS